MSADISPIDLAKALTPHWMRNIEEFNGLEIAPCRVVGHDRFDNAIVEPCDDAPEQAAFWTVYGHYRTGGVDAFEDFPTEAEARAFHDQVVSVYPHLAAQDEDHPASFMDYWEAVDAAMLKCFGIDTGDAGIDAELIASAQEEGQTPEEFARWYGAKYDLTYIDDWKALYNPFPSGEGGLTP